MIRVLVADDEVAARGGLKALLSRDEEVEVVGESATGRETCEAVRSLRPDLVFLDIRMPDMDAFEALEELDPEQVPLIVFVTAFDEYSLQAFDAEAVDYLLKPFTDERFFKALARAKEQCQRLEAEELRERLLPLISGRLVEREEPWLRRLAVGPRDDLRFLDLALVRWIEADAYRVRVHWGENPITLRGNLGSFEKRLDPNEFFRISRSAIVNVAHVRRVKTLFHDQALAVLSDGTELNVSRSRRAAFVSLLERTRS